MTEQKCLAEQAMDIHDAQGEIEMLSFVRLRLDTRPAGHENNPSPLMVLQDHTAVMARGDRYTFLWTPDDPVNHHPLPCARTRSHRERPLPTPGELRPIPVNGAVTRERILHESLKLIETDVRLALGHSEHGAWLGNDPPVGEAALRPIAPRFIEIINEHASMHIETDEAYNLFDQYAMELAREILEATNPQERAATTAAILEAITISA